MNYKKQKNSFNDVQATFEEHISGLISSVKPIFYLFIILFVGIFFLSEGLLELFSGKYNLDVYVLHPYEVILTRLKISLYLSGLISLPLLFISMVRFFKPALEPSEYKTLLITFFSIFGFSVIGGFLSFYFGLEIIMNILQRFATDVNFINAWSISNIIDFIIRISMAVAIVSNIPVLIYGTVSSGLISSEKIRNNKKKIFVLFVLISALVTPPDIITLLFVSTLMYLLFLSSLKLTEILVSENY